MLCVTQTNKQHQFFGIFNYYYNKWFIAGLLLGQQKCRRRRNKTFLSTDNIACMKRFLLYFLQSNIYRLLSSWMFFKRHLGGEWGGSEERCCGRSSEEITQSIFFHIRLFVNPLYSVSIDWNSRCQFMTVSLIDFLLSLSLSLLFSHESNSHKMSGAKVDEEEEENTKKEGRQEVIQRSSSS